MRSIFVTGASGTIGHYLVDELASDPENEIHLLVRNPAKLRVNPAWRGRITVVQGDLNDIAAQAELLARMDYCVHVAAAWGGENAWRINVDRTHELFTLLNPERLRRVVYFSTASILGRGNQVLPEADQYGTSYIRSKYRGYMELPTSPVYDRTVTVFPTLVFGGDAGHPLSHLSRGLPLFKRYAWLLGRFDIDASFHFIHAQDIARITRHLLTASEAGRDYVLGNEPLTFGEFTRRVAAYFGHRVRRQIRLTPETLRRIAAVTRLQMPAWTRFCLEYKDFTYQTVNCPSLGLPSNHTTVEEIMADWEIVRDALQKAD